MQIGDIISIDNSDHLEVVSRLDRRFVWVKPVEYNVYYERCFNFDSCSIATDEQICANISEWVKKSYINKLESEI